MFKVNVLSSDTILTKAILYHGAKIKEDSTNFIYTNINKLCRIHRESKRFDKSNKSKKTDEFIPFLNAEDPTEIKYKEKIIHIWIVSSWDQSFRRLWKSCVLEFKWW